MKDYTDVINDLNAGITASTLTAVLCEAASRVLANEKPGEVTLTLKLKPLKGTQNQPPKATKARPSPTRLFCMSMPKAR